MRTTPLAGARLNAHLRSLLMLFGTYLGPIGVVGQNPKPSAVPEDALLESIIEDVKTKCCFVGTPILLSKASPQPPSPSASTSSGDNMILADPPDTGTDVDASHTSKQRRASGSSLAGPSTQVHTMRDLYVLHSTATDLTVKIPAPGMAPTGPGTTTFTRASLLIPGWIRERGAELLFEDGDIDETSVAEVILDSLLKVSQLHCIFNFDLTILHLRSRSIFEENSHPQSWSREALVCFPDSYQDCKLSSSDSSPLL